MSHKAVIPRSALVLGWSGVFPFALLAVVIAAAANVTDTIDPKPALIFYAAIILSFMGGVHWGLAISAAPIDGAATSPQATRLGLSTIPALVGWLATLVPFGMAVALLIGAFIALFAYDNWAATQGWTPAWYPRLRLQLTAAVVAALALAWSTGS